MLKRPTSRRKSHGEQIQLNLVPILDTMVTLIGFLLFTTSFFSVVTIESPFPQTNSKEVAQRLSEKPLQLTVSVREKDVEIWSPFDRIAPKFIPHTAPGQPNVKAIHEALVGIKQKFPAETKAVITPNASVTYDVLISVMDSMRNVEVTDPQIYALNKKTGNDEVVKILFPEVIFGNLLGDS